jgi:hypothetical protein
VLVSLATNEVAADRRAGTVSCHCHYVDDLKSSIFNGLHCQGLSMRDVSRLREVRERRADQARAVIVRDDETLIGAGPRA